MMAPSIAQLTKSCRHELDAIAKRHRDRPMATRSDTIDQYAPMVDLASWVKDQQTKLNLFADALGVFARGTLSVEHRLRVNSAARNAIVQLLEAISNNAKLCAQYPRDIDEPRAQPDYDIRTTGTAVSTSSADVVERRSSTQMMEDLSDLAVNRVGRDITNLVSFAALIRLRSMQEYSERSRGFDPKSEDGVSLLPYFEKVVDRVLSESSEKDTLAEHDIMKERIKSTIVRRWIRICYSIHRSEQLRDPGQGFQEEDTENKGDYDEGVSDTAYHSKPENLALQYSDASRGIIAPSQKATTFAGSLAPKMNAPGPQSLASSVALSITGDASARLPKLKRDKVSYNSGILEFFCPLCRIPQQIKSEEAPHMRHRAWEKHAYHDLEPYICLFDACDKPEKTYQTLEEWIAHNGANHAQSMWACQNCPEVFSDQLAFESHVQEGHGLALTADQIAFIAKNCSRRVSAFTACALCGKYKKPDSDTVESQDTLAQRESQMLSCMARHMKSLALISLPDNLSVSSDSDSSNARVTNGSRASASSEAVQSISKPSSESTIQFQEGLNQLYAWYTLTDRANSTNDWRLQCSVNDGDNVPQDHASLIKHYAEGHLWDHVIPPLQASQDFIGDGPPWWGGNYCMYCDMAFNYRNDHIRHMETVRHIDKVRGHRVNKPRSSESTSDFTHMRSQLTPPTLHRG